jgi:hypothetical protein
MHIACLMKGSLAVGLAIILLGAGCGGNHYASRPPQAADYESNPPNLSFGPPAG